MYCWQSSGAQHTLSCAPAQQSQAFLRAHFKHIPWEQEGSKQPQWEWFHGNKKQSGKSSEENWYTAAFTSPNDDFNSHKIDGHDLPIQTPACAWLSMLGGSTSLSRASGTCWHVLWTNKPNQTTPTQPPAQQLCFCTSSPALCSKEQAAGH